MHRLNSKRLARRGWPMMLALFSMLISTSMMSAGCNHKTQTSREMPSPAEQRRIFVEALRATLDDELREQAEDVASGDAIQKLIATENARAWAAREKTGIKYANLLVGLYPERQFHKVFAQSSGLTPRGQGVLTILKDADRHALKASDYLVERIEELDARLDELSSGEPHWRTITLSGEETNQLVAWLDKHDLDPGEPHTRRQLLGALVGAMPPEIVPEAPADNPDSDSADADETSKKPTPRTAPEVRTPEVLPSPLPRVTERMAEFLEAFSKNAGINAELEVRVADGALRYARDMRHFNLSREDWRDFRKAGGSNAIIFSRLEQTFDDIYNAEPEEVAGLMTALWPSHPQYQMLLLARARYQEIAENGGWKSVPTTTITLGARSPRVAQLRERLAIEGFLPQESEAQQTEEQQTEERAQKDSGESDDANANAQKTSDEDESAQPGPDEVAESTLSSSEETAPDLDRVDEALIQGIKAYQSTHQFNPNGKPDNIFWRSLNVPVERRIRQIELSIQRWRETQYRDEADYIMVNIPDFHAEVFRDHERQLRFRVVTGNNKRVCDPKTKQWTYPQATPIMMASLDHMIFNPYWYVPQSIIKNELEPKMTRDPDYLEKNGYEKVMMNGRETIRQVPGPDNALGSVKFIFPNAGNIYMHDTPTKRYFDFPVRAFSHGCVRVHEPEKLATYLLEHNEKDHKFSADELFKAGKQKYIELDQKMPVFIEYKTVHVDDEGRPNFLADIYRRDQLKLITDPAKREEYLSCRVPRPVSADPWGDDTSSGSQPAGVETDIGP